MHGFDLDDPRSNVGHFSSSKDRPFFRCLHNLSIAMSSSSDTPYTSLDNEMLFVRPYYSCDALTGLNGSKRQTLAGRLWF